MAHKHEIPLIPLSQGRNAQQKPEWLKVRVRETEGYRELKKLVADERLNTVCEEARCPNIYECWGHRTATFMMMGDVCTRHCGFCSVGKGRPGTLDADEPRRVAESIAKLALKHAVVTSVNRDDLPDGGAAHFAAMIHAVKRLAPQTKIEILIPDFLGDPRALDVVMQARPDVLAHNIETVKRLYADVRPDARYERTLELLACAVGHKASYPVVVKCGFMLGLGEQEGEIAALLQDIRAHGSDVVTLGQYLAPTRAHLPVQRFVTPDEFAHWREFGLSIGFGHVESGPLVRSSYHAHEHVPRG